MTDSPAAPPPAPDPAGSREPSTAERRREPALIVNTGDGKGKTTAAMGLALRGWAQGWSVGVYAFLKSGQWPVGERAALLELGRSAAGGSVTWADLGSGRTALRKRAADPTPAELAREAWERVAADLAEERHDLYVLDEFTYPLAYGWVPLADAIPALRDRPGRQHVVITGRRAPEELIAIATTVTEMRKVTHPYDSGQRGQAGIEW